MAKDDAEITALIDQGEAWHAAVVDYVRRRGSPRISHHAGTVLSLIAALRVETAHLDREEAREAMRIAAAAAPRYDEHEIRSTERLIELGHLPAGSTPADFRALQEKRRAEGGQRGAVPLPTGGAE